MSKDYKTEGIDKKTFIYTRVSTSNQKDESNGFF